MVYEEGTVGARLRILRRRRRMSLAQLAGQAGLSKSFLSMAERGQRALDRRSHIAALASALRVSETELVGGPHLSEDPVRSAPHAAIPAIREALLTNTLTAPVADRARPLADLVAEMIRIDRSRAKFVEVGARLPLHTLPDSSWAVRIAARRGRHAMFLADVGRGLAREARMRDEAVRWLHRAESIAPHKIRNDARVRDTVAVMLEQARTASLGRELRGMAARMGIPH